jgi:antiviral helicase SKI2
LIPQIAFLPQTAEEKIPETMTDGLVSALERVHLESNTADGAQDNWIDHILDEQRPRKRMKQAPEDLKRELEQKYLTPSTSFSGEWLNKLQQ